MPNLSHSQKIQNLKFVIGGKIHNPLQCAREFKRMLNSLTDRDIVCSVIGAFASLTQHYDETEVDIQTLKYLYHSIY
jgi:hypothetical protein